MAIIGLETFIAATIWCLLIPVFHLALIWSSRRKELHIRWMFTSFVLVGLIIVAKHLESSGVEIGVALSTFGFWALGYMEAFSMLCRGFSLTILCDLKEKQPLSASELVRQYGGGKGAAWLLEKRMNGLLSLKFIRSENDDLILLSGKPQFLSRATSLYKRILKLGFGG